MKHTLRFWEELHVNIFPSFNHMLHDGWLLRFADGRSSHNNSIWPLYAGELPLTEKIAFCERQFAERGFACCFRLAEMPGHDTIENQLTDRGYVEENPNLVLVNPSIGGPDAEITELGLDEWLETVFDCRSRGRRHAQSMATTSIQPDGVTAALRHCYAQRASLRLWLFDSTGRHPRPK